MKGVAKDKVVTSGRPAGRGAAQPTRRPLVPQARAAACPRPAYSLYSSDSQEQVASLHNSLDRYDALLSGLLQAEPSDSLSDLGRPKDATVKSKLPAASPGRKSGRKAPAKTGADGSGGHPAGLTTPRTRAVVPVAHSGVRLYPARKKVQTGPSRLQAPARQPSPPTSLPGPKSRGASRRSEGESGGEDFIPARDAGARRRSFKTPEKNGAEDAKGPGGAEGGVRTQTVQYLLRELKALIIGEGSLAEMLLRRLEQAMTSPSLDAGVQSEAEAALLQSQNLQLRRDVEELQQQLKLKKPAEMEKADELRSSQASGMQQDLSAALSQLRELQNNLSDLQKAHRDSQTQLEDRERANTLLRADLEATRKRLLDSEREKGELAAQWQRRLQEAELLQRDLQGRFSSEGTFVGSSVSQQQQQQQQQQNENASEHINHYLRSMRPHTAAQGRAPGRGPGPGAGASAPGGPGGLPQGPASPGPAAPRDDRSAWSDSTFNTRDEAAFREGLSALDTSIANLMKSFQADHGRMCS